MRTILVTRHVYGFGQEQELDYVVHGTGWKYSIDKEFCILEILDNQDIVASYKHWQGVKFGDQLQEGKLL